MNKSMLSDLAYTVLSQLRAEDAAMERPKLVYNNILLHGVVKDGCQKFAVTYAEHTLIFTQPWHALDTFCVMVCPFISPTRVAHVVIQSNDRFHVLFDVAVTRTMCHSPWSRRFARHLMDVLFFSQYECAKR